MFTRIPWRGDNVQLADGSKGIVITWGMSDWGQWWITVRLFNGRKKRCRFDDTIHRFYRV